jgi:hypothetical protein
MNKTLPSHPQFPSRRHLQAIWFSLGILSLGLTYPAVAQDRGQTQSLPLRTITVTGRGLEATPTTITQVRLGVEVQGKTATAVQQEAARRSSAVVALLRSRNVEKLQTTGISLNPNYSYENNVQRLIGYVATNTVSFRVDNQRAGAIIDEAVNAGATRIDGINFVASDNAIATAQQQALREATQDAQQQADAVLGALNLTRRDVVTIQVNNATPPIPPPMPVLAREALDQKNASTPIVGGEQEVEASVTLQISY